MSLAAGDKARLQAGIETSLANFNYKNAVFLAERLLAAAPSDENTYALATCLYRNGQAKQAYHLLHGNVTTTGGDMPPRSRFLLGRCCFDIGELAEAETVLLLRGNAPPAGISGGELGAWYELLGAIYKQTNRPDEAKRHFRLALQADSLLWTAYEGLCELAADVDSAEIFTEVGCGGCGGPSGMATADMSQDVTRTPNPRMNLSYSGATPSTADTGAPGQQPAASNAGSADLFRLLQDLGAGYNALCMYRCQEAVASFSGVHSTQHNTGWVLTQIGRAHFEMNDYTAAESVFQRLRQVAPHRLDGLEIYSTLLWHLRKEVELCYLAQQAMELDRRAPQCLCVVGNCFALQKEHESALKFFQRYVRLSRLCWSHMFTCLGFTLSAHISRTEAE